MRRDLTAATADGLGRDCVAAFDNLHTLPRAAFRRRVAVWSPGRLGDACTALNDALGCGAH